MKNVSVYKYIIQFDGDDDIQVRYIVASSEEEAARKMEEYHDGLIEYGFSEVFYSYRGVELDYCII